MSAPSERTQAAGHHLTLAVPEPRCVSCPGNNKAHFPGPIREAGDGARTHDPQLGKLMLYQLSYARNPSRLAISQRL